MTPLERVGVAPIVKKLVENRLRWFGHIKRRPVDKAWLLSKVIVRLIVVHETFKKDYL